MCLLQTGSEFRISANRPVERRQSQYRSGRRPPLMIHINLFTCLPRVRRKRDCSESDLLRNFDLPGGGAS